MTETATAPVVWVQRKTQGVPSGPAHIRGDAGLSQTWCGRRIQFTHRNVIDPAVETQCPECVMRHAAGKPRAWRGRH